MKRIYSLDFLKLLFAYIIALGHFGTIIAPGGGVVVQLFYILSGFFLARKYYSKTYSDPDKKYDQWKYTKDHVKSLYPHYLFSLTILALYLLAKSIWDFIGQPDTKQLYAIATDIYELIPEFLLLQNSGLFQGGINYPLWQMCALVISGYFVYGFLCVNEKLSRQLIFPAAILMIQAFLKTGIDVWGTEGFFHVPLLRAFSPMCIGVLAYYFSTTPLFERIKAHKKLFNCASILCLLSFFVFEGHGNIFLITFVVVLLAIYDSESWINKVLDRKLFKHFGNFSYAIYLNHALVGYILDRHVFHRISDLFSCSLSQTQKDIMFLAVLTVYSVLTLIVVDKLKNICSRKKS